MLTKGGGGLSAAVATLLDLEQRLARLQRLQKNQNQNQNNSTINSNQIPSTGGGRDVVILEKRAKKVEDKVRLAIHRSNNVKQQVRKKRKYAYIYRFLLDLCHQNLTTKLPLLPRQIVEDASQTQCPLPPSKEPNL